MFWAVQETVKKTSERRGFGVKGNERNRADPFDVRGQLGDVVRAAARDREEAQLVTGIERPDRAGAGERVSIGVHLVENVNA
jgi:hypothetical protein